MKQGWKDYSLKEVTDLITCGVAKRPDYTDDGIPFLSAKNVKNGKVIWSDHRYISLEAHQVLTKINKPKQGDILYTRVGSFGEAAIVDKNIEFSLFVSLTLIKPKSHILNNTYLKYYLNSNKVKTRAKNSISSSGVGNLNVGTVRKFPIPIPPLEEQKQIVVKLDQCFEAIDKAKANAAKNLENAKELFQSKLNEIFSQKGEGWVEKKLGDIAKDFGRGKSKHRPRNDKLLFGGEFPFVQTGDVRNANKILTSYTQTYNKTGLAQSKLWDKGTVCITIAANIAETAILDFSGCFPDSIIGFVADEKTTSNHYVYYVLQYYKSELQRLGKGSAQDNINLGTFKKHSFPFPSLNEQNSIVNKLDKLKEHIQSLESKYQQELNSLEELKKSILQKAFEGEL